MDWWLTEPVVNRARMNRWLTEPGWSGGSQSQDGVVVNRARMEWWLTEPGWTSG